jgi:hypothetical protein
MPAIRKNICFAHCAFWGMALTVMLSSIGHAQPGRRGQPIEGSETGNSTREARDAAVAAIPFPHLTPQANSRLNAVIEKSSYFRRMPVQTMVCEPEILVCLARNPEVLVSIWDSMGITKVELSRTAQYQHSGNDGAGTTCNMDLIYGNDTTHVYLVDGNYKGSMWPKELTGKSVIVLHHRSAKTNDGSHRMTVWMDVFLKLDNLGADLIVRTLGPLVNKSADSNFVESVNFVSQISQAAVNNPKGLEALTSRLRINQNVRDQFLQAARAAAARNHRVVRAEPVNSITGDGQGVSESFDAEPVLLLGNLAAESRVPPATPAQEYQISTRRKPNDGKANDSPTIQKLNGNSPK